MSTRERIPPTTVAAGTSSLSHPIQNKPGWVPRMVQLRHLRRRHRAPRALNLSNGEKNNENSAATEAGHSSESAGAIATAPAQPSADDVDANGSDDLEAVSHVRILASMRAHRAAG